MAIASEKKETAVNLIPDKLNSIQEFFKRRLDGNEAKSFRAGASHPVVLNKE